MALSKRYSILYPGGAIPGFNSAHPFSPGTQLSAVLIPGAGGNFLNLKPGFSAAISTASGTVATSTDPVLGPVKNTGSGYSAQFTSTAQGTADGTAAAIIRTGVSDNCGIFQASTSLGGPQLADFSGVLFWSNTTQDQSSGIALADNTPYFVLASCQSATGAVNFLVRNLNTGAIQTASTTIVGLNAALDSGFTIGKEFKYGTFFDGNIAAVYYSQFFFTIPQLFQWGADPWAFWYPTVNTPGLAFAQAPAAGAATPTWGWESSPQIRRPTLRADFRSDDGIQAPKINWFNAGWEVQPSPPRRPTPRAAGWLRGDDGTEAKFEQWRNAGWETQPPQPPRQRWERRGAILPKDDGTQFPLINWVNAGWEVQPFQPRHPKPERGGAWMIGDAGIEAAYIPISTPAWGWDVQLVQPPYRINRLPSMLRGDDGTQATYVVWRNGGWEAQSFQPPHPTPERRAAGIMRGEDGTELPFARWFNFGWEVAPHQPSHPRPERAAAWLAGDAGIYAPYIFVPPPPSGKVYSYISSSYIM